jgi:hypothetical protein
MSRALMQSTTRIAIHVETDTAQVTQLLQAITVLVGLLFAVGNLVRPVVIFAADFVEAATFTVKVLTIGFNSFAYGFGVTG